MHSGEPVIKAGPSPHQQGEHQDAVMPAKGWAPPVLACRIPQWKTTYIHFLPKVRVLSAANQTLLLGGQAGPHGQRRVPGRTSHLVRGCLSLLGAHSILLVVDKHDQANEAAHAEDQLLAREDGIAGAAERPVPRL